MFNFKEDSLYNEKHKYTEIANAIFVWIFKEWEARHFETKFVESKYSWIFQNNEIPLACVKTKVSHIKRYKTTRDTFGISSKLIELYEALKNVSYNKIKNAIEQSLYGGYVNFYRMEG